jgi:FAD/FMN-containing dehydrogenase/Fe-S oxidoreductase
LSVLHSRCNGRPALKISESDLLHRLEAELAPQLQGEIRFDEMTRGLYSTDASIYQIRPLGVVFPQSREDVVAVMRKAAEYRVPVLPRGGGTSLSGQAVARALVIDFSRFMHRILDVDLTNQLVKVQSGVVLEQLNAALRPQQLQFGPDVSTASRAAIGGMIANNSAGSHSLIHGKTIDHVRSLNVVLSDGSEILCEPLTSEELLAKQALPTLEGQIYRQFPVLVRDLERDIMARYPRVLRRVSGYNLDAFVPSFYQSLPSSPSSKKLDQLWPDRKFFNLSRLFVGSEGTLGIVTEATLHAIPLPQERGVACLVFESVDAAVRAVTPILNCLPSAVELLDKFIVELSRENLAYRKYLDFVEGAPAALLIVEFMGDTRYQVEDGFSLLEQRLRDHPGLLQFIRAESADQADKIWRCREAGAPLLLSIPGARKPIAFVEDPAVEPSKLPEFTRRFRDVLTRHGASGAYYGHASVGCLHLRPLIDTKSGSDLQRMKAISDDVVKLVIEFKGAMSGEHGDGLSRSYHNPALFGPRIYSAFQQIKKLFDPLGLLNPGKIVDGPSPIESLRYGTEYHSLPVVAFQDFSHEAQHSDMPVESGFLAAAEMCNGSGVCRKTHTGTMCPSFMVTHDEEHSPRGRANALRLALSGQLSEGALTSERMHDVMDLCLLCKGCKAECPSNVDVAKLKVEFLAHYNEQHRPSFSTVIQAHVATVNRIGSALAPVSNWLGKIPPLRWIMGLLSGIDRRRSLPQFYRRHFRRWFGRHQEHPQAGSRGDVVLLDDCLTSYCEPQINQSAVELLEQAGYRVHRAGLWCCGRPMISKGLLEPAKRLVRRNVTTLLEFVSKGWPILGVEPSCLLTLVDEYPDLFPSEATELVKRNSFLLDGWIADRAARGEFPMRLTPLPQTALVHGHCQQKALVGMSGTQRALQLIPDLQVKTVDSGCCGMAGAFGYDHYDVSQQIGQRVLFPAVEEHRQGPVIAPGFSCRHQIEDGTEQHAMHPIELLAKQLRD